MPTRSTADSMELLPTLGVKPCLNVLGVKTCVNRPHGSITRAVKIHKLKFYSMPAY